MRRFQTKPLPEGELEQLISLACLAPSVGLSEPWRFVNVTTAALREKVTEQFEIANREALSGYSGEQAALYASLKLAGLRDAPVHLAVFSDPATQQGSGLGQRTMPETLEYSVVGAVHTLWLAARAQGIGLGWVSILDPGRVTKLLDVPEGWRLIAYLCLGYPEAEHETPELERSGWERRSQSSRLLQR